MEKLPLDEIARVAWISRMLAVAARLEIADHLATGPTAPEDIAEAIGVDPDALYFLMCSLASNGIFQRHADGTFSNSTESERLTADHPESMRNYCLLIGEMYYDAWGGLLHTVRTGEPAFRHVFGCSIHDYMDTHPREADVYDQAMQELARPVARQLARCDGFSRAHRVIDVGGGNGELLREIIERNPGIEGVCVDREDTCVRAAERLRRCADEKLTRRLRFRAADFLTDVPEDGDTFILQNVLHNWSAETSVKILAAVREAMFRASAEDPSLLVIEPLIEHDQDMSIRALAQMVVCEQGTRERDEAELRGEVEAAGLRVRTIETLTTGHSVVECKLAAI